VTISASVDTGGPTSFSTKLMSGIDACIGTGIGAWIGTGIGTGIDTGVGTGIVIGIGAGNGIGTGIGSVLDLVLIRQFGGPSYNPRWGKKKNYKTPVKKNVKKITRRLSASTQWWRTGRM